MQNYQIALIFDEHHDRKAIRLMGRLQKTGINVLRCTQYTPVAEIGQNIKKSEFVFVLLVDDAPFPAELNRVTDQLLQTIQDRDKQLYVIKEYRAPLPPDFQGYPILKPEDGTMLSPEGGGIAGRICNLVVGTENKQVLYEKLSSLLAIDYHPGIIETLAALLDLLCKEFISSAPRSTELRDKTAEILSILEDLSRYELNYWTDDRQQQYAILRKLLNTAINIPTFAQQFRSCEDLFCLACALRILELYHVIRANCVYITTNGDVCFHNNPLPEIYGELSRQFLSGLQSEHNKNLDLRYSPEQIGIIDRQNVQCQKVAASMEDLSGSESLTSILSQNTTNPVNGSYLSEADIKLFNIAEFLNQGYSLFESVFQAQPTADFLRCLKTGFERLKNYCDIVEAKAVSAQCINSIVQIDQQLGRIDEDEGNVPQDKPSLGLKALLGLKSPTNGHYDVFLSYKHEDEDIVRKVYHYLKSKRLNAFFDKVTLPELSESDYDEAIMNALDHSRHFLVIITDLAQLQTYWIKLEMKTFHHEMVEGRKNDSNFIILVTDRVYNQLIASNKTELPLRYRSCEIMRIRDYKDSLLGYLTK